MLLEYRRRILHVSSILVLIISIAGIISGCSPNVVETNDSISSKEKGGETNFLIKEIQQDFDEDEFNKKHPGYQINFVEESGMEHVSITNYSPYDLANLPNLYFATEK